MEGHPLEQIRLVLQQILHLEVTGEDPRLNRYVDINLDVWEQLLLTGEGIYHSAPVLGSATMQEHPLLHCAEFELSVLGGLLITPTLMIVLMMAPPTGPLKLDIVVVIV